MSMLGLNFSIIGKVKKFLIINFLIFLIICFLILLALQVHSMSVVKVQDVTLMVLKKNQ